MEDLTQAINNIRSIISKVSSGMRLVEYPEQQQFELVLGFNEEGRPNISVFSHSSREGDNYDVWTIKDEKGAFVATTFHGPKAYANAFAFAHLPRLLEELLDKIEEQNRLIREMSGEG